MQIQQHLIQCYDEYFSIDVVRSHINEDVVNICHGSL